MLYLRAMLVMCLPAFLFSLPQGAEIGSGSAEFIQIDEGVLEIHASDKAIINYEKFDIREGETVRFIQPNSQSTVLNRIRGSDPSSILGSLDSNGRVFFVNPNGIYFGANAEVNVGALVASTLDILDTDFLNDKLAFYTKKGTAKALIYNLGKIHSAEGSIAFLAPHIKNEGIISAVAGTTLLASAEAVILDFSGDGLLSFVLEGDLEEAVIEHLGSMRGEEVFMKMKVANKAIREIVNTEGVVEADQLIKQDGTIRIVKGSSLKAQSIKIDAGENARVIVSGEIDASGVQGGKVEVLGDDLELRGASIDASGVFGGGSIFIGGNYKGEGPLKNAVTNFTDEHSFIKASAIESGDGGKVILWADETTVFNGQIEAKGGIKAGNGGFVETSGKVKLGVQSGHVDTSALSGISGQWLLDPDTIVIEDTGGTGLANIDSCLDSSIFTVTAATINGAGSNLTLCASTAITLKEDSPINISGLGIGITFQGGGTSLALVTLNNDITTNGGTINFVGSDVYLGSDVVINSKNGAISLGASSLMDGDKHLTLVAGTGNIVFSGTLGGITPISALSVTSGKDISFSRITAGSITQLSSSGVTSLNGPVVVTGIEGIVLLCKDIHIEESVKTIGGGSVILKNSGSFTLGSGGSIESSGAFIQNGTGSVSLSSNITSH
jgi:filamentous hemagglutinin family protein